MNNLGRFAPRGPSPTRADDCARRPGHSASPVASEGATFERSTVARASRAALRARKAPRMAVPTRPGAHRRVNASWATLERQGLHRALVGVLSTTMCAARSRKLARPCIFWSAPHLGVRIAMARPEHGLEGLCSRLVVEVAYKELCAHRDALCALRRRPLTLRRCSPRTLACAHQVARIPHWSEGTISICTFTAQ